MDAYPYISTIVLNPLVFFFLQFACSYCLLTVLTNSLFKRSLAHARLCPSHNNAGDNPLAPLPLPPRPIPRCPPSHHPNPHQPHKNPPPPPHASPSLLRHRRNSTIIPAFHLGIRVSALFVPSSPPRHLLPLHLTSSPRRRHNHPIALRRPLRPPHHRPLRDPKRPRHAPEEGRMGGADRGGE